MPQNLEITELLHRWTAGEKAALDELVPLVERELRKIARRALREERSGHSLQTTELVNEAYLRLVDQTRSQWQNRAHFFAIAGHIIRRVLLDHARSRNRAKRGAGANISICRVSSYELRTVATRRSTVFIRRWSLTKISENPGCRPLLTIARLIVGVALRGHPSL